MNLQTPYLDAIQAIPGSSAYEKYKWIGNHLQERMSSCETLEEMMESDKIPRPLMPLIQLKIALILCKKKPEVQSNYEAIAEALKSDDYTILKGALRATNFFNGKNPKITNVDYFFNHLFPYVSLNTRTQIIKQLAYKLPPEKSSLAEEFFIAVASTYGVKQAVPLLIACGENFTYEKIIEHKLVLSEKIVSILFERNVDLALKYFKLTKINLDPNVRYFHNIRLDEYSNIIVKLIKKKLQSFIELYETYGSVLYIVSLSEKCAASFLKNGKEYFLQKPQTYINLLPLKLISTACMESIFPKLLPKDIKDFSTDKALQYLQYYPQERKLSFLMKSYEEVYGKSILENVDHVNVALMLILPVEERIKQAKIKITMEKDNYNNFNYNYTWRCYLSIEEAIPEIKKEISLTNEAELRMVLLSQMIYCCKVNDDTAALLEVLEFIKSRHKNEIYLVKVIETLLKLYNLERLSTKHWTVLFDIFKYSRIKRNLPSTHETTLKFLESTIYYRIHNDLPFQDIIEMYVDAMITTCGKWNILKDYPYYEKMSLEASISTLHKKYDSNKIPEENRGNLICDVVSSIYDFNTRHTKRRIEKMSVRSYPWLMKEIEDIVSADDYNTPRLKSLFRHHEVDLYTVFWKWEVKHMYVERALHLLESEPEFVLENWEKYFEWCKTNWYAMNVKRFVKALRWYNDIPIKFVEKCVQNVINERSGTSLQMSAVLLHGQTYGKFVEPLLPTKTIIDVDHKHAGAIYSLVSYISSGMKYTNPPVPLELISRLCEGDYLQEALEALRNFSRRTSVTKVISFAKTLTDSRVSVKKHGIRILFMVMPLDQFHDFLISQWKIEKNHSIRQLLLTQACKLFHNDAGPTTWTLLTDMISTLTLEDNKILHDLVNVISQVPNEYITDYINLLLETIDKLSEAGLQKYLATSYTKSVLRAITVAIYCLLPETFVKKLFKKFLFNVDSTYTQHMIAILVSYLSSFTTDYDKRIRLFTETLISAVKNGWNVHHPRRTHYYPVNNGIYELINRLVNMPSCYDEGKQDDPFWTARVASDVLDAFTSVLNPRMAPKPYLQLTYMKELSMATSSKDFGMRLANKLTQLVELFSAMFIPCMSKELEVFLQGRYFYGCNRSCEILDVMEGLLEGKSNETGLMAAGLLMPLKEKGYAEQYRKVVKRLKDFDDPAIKSTVCDALNEMTENSFICDIDD